MAMTRMSKDAMDDKIGPLLKPEFVTSIVALLAAEEHKGTGDCTLLEFAIYRYGCRLLL